MMPVLTLSRSIAAAFVWAMDEAEAVGVALLLRGAATTIQTSLVKKLQAALPDGVVSLDKSGHQVQDEVLQLALLTRGERPTPEAARELIDSIRAWKTNGQVASFLQFWEQLSLMAGVHATGAGNEVHTTWIDWYRGPSSCARYLPSLRTLRRPAALEEFVLQGWAPRAPLIGHTCLVTALGSCFADEIRIWLRARGFRVNEDFRQGMAYPHAEDSIVPLLQCSAGLVNTFVLLQQFEWAFEGKVFDDDLWWGSRGQVVLPTEDARRRTRAMFESSKLFVITLGLAEIWFQKRGREVATSSTSGCSDESGKRQQEDVLWRAIPSHKFDPRRHGFRVSSVDENLTNLRRIVDIIHRHNPGASIVFTLSPVPLSATFRGVSCVTANSVSKSILRVAVDELLREKGVGIVSASSVGSCPSSQSEDSASTQGQLYYWPAYEMIKEAFAEPYLDDGRHVKPEVVQKVLSLFGKYYCREVSSSDCYIKPAFKLGNSTFRQAAEQRRLDAELPSIVPSTPFLHAEIPQAHVQSLLDEAKPTRDL